jgi:hypothetical protein
MWLGELPPINPKKYNDEFTGWRTTTIGGIPVTEESVISANAVYYAKWLDIPEGWTWNPGLHELSKTFGCTGGVQQFTVINEGRYTFELFGAAGGKNGGKGGYSKGTLANLGEGTTLYIYVGGKGDTASGLAGWNGGGAGNGHSSYGGGGGGATDVRFETELNTRVIVAGGGGGGGDYLGGNGGGLSGGKGSGPSADDSYYGGKGATASEAGKGNGPSNTYGAGGYGYGGAATYSNGYPGGGGGGGYWGGGGGYAYGGGGGGSGFIYGYSETPGDPSKPLPSKYRIYPFTSDMSCIQGGGSTGDGQVKVTWRPRS